MKKIQVKRLRICEECDGKGGKNAEKCVDCKGAGVAIKMVQIGFGMMAQAQVECEKCKGQGTIMKEEDKCKACETKKVVEKEATIEVAIEQGCPDLHDYILTG